MALPRPWSIVFYLGYQAVIQPPFYSVSSRDLIKSQAIFILCPHYPDLCAPRCLFHKLHFTGLDQQKEFCTFPIANPLGKTTSLPTVISLLIGSGFYAFGVYMEYKNREIEKQKKIAEEVTAQLESLKNQIDPHFLFNSLNVLIGLIEENQKNAITYTQSLAQIYRYVLSKKNNR